MNKIHFLCLSVLILFSCGDKQGKKESGPTAEIDLELVDSLVVDLLDPLAMDDYSSENGYYLVKGRKSRKPYLVDEKGTIIQEYDVLHEGPDGLGANGAFGFRFLDREHWLAQSLFSGYHMYDLQGKKLKTFPSNYQEVHSITVYTHRTTYNPFVKGGVPYIIGEESNLIDQTEVNAKKLGADFYTQAKSIYQYNLETEENKLLETFPPSWTPREEGRFVGESFPLVAYHQTKQEMALLPPVGNQLFVYDFSGEEPVLKDTVELVHRHRPEAIPDIAPDAEPWQSDYPRFTDIRYLGEDILVGFSTKIPMEVMRELRAKSEQYYNLPEYQEASRDYVKPYYLLVREGKQVGVLEKFPVNGTLDFTDEAGILYINDNISPEIERDYNVFYKLKVKE